MRFAFSKEDEEEEEEEHEQSVKIVFHTSCDIFIHFFAMQLPFHMFSTLMSLEDRLKVKIEISVCIAEPPIAIPIYTVLPYCVIV